MTSETPLYVIKHEHGYVKIGKSTNPEDRLTTLQSACPYELEVFTTFDVIGDWRTVESHLHDVYSSDSVRGEWFDIPTRQLVYLDEINTVRSDLVDSIPEWTPKYHVELDERVKQAWYRNDAYDRGKL